MKSSAPYAGEAFPDVGLEDDIPPYIDNTHAPMDVGEHNPANPVSQSAQHPYLYISPLPSCFPFDTFPQDNREDCQTLEWSIVLGKTVPSNPQTRDPAFSIYGTSSDYYASEDLAQHPLLPSPISSLGSPDIPSPLNSTAMVWERLPASDHTSPDDTYPLQAFHQAPYHGDEMDLLEANDLIREVELDPVLPINTRSSSLSTTAELTESSTTSEYITLEEPEMSPAKRRRVSTPSLRWSTTGKPRKKQAQTTIIFPQSSIPPTPKTNHNAIEKQYRNRLNDKFEALLSVLPSHETERAGGSLGKVSKGDVLILAKDYIESLKKSRDAMQEDRQFLEDNVKGMQEVWTLSRRP